MAFADEDSSERPSEAGLEGLEDWERRISAFPSALPLIEDYVQTSTDAELPRVRRFLAKLGTTHDGLIASYYGSVLVGGRTEDRALAERAAVQVLRREPNHPLIAAQFDPERFLALEALAARHRELDARMQSLLPRLKSGDDDAWAELEQMMLAEPTYHRAQRLFFQRCVEVPNAGTVERTYRALVDAEGRSQDLGLFAGKAFAAANKPDSALQAYVRALLDAPKNQETPRQVAQLVLSLPALRIEAQKRLEAALAIATDRSAVEAALERLLRGEAPPSPPRAPAAPTSPSSVSTEIDPNRIWDEAHAEGTYAAFLRAARSLESMGELGRAEWLYNRARGQNREDVEAGEAVRRIQRSRAGATTGGDALAPRREGAAGVPALAPKALVPLPEPEFQRLHAKLGHTPQRSDLIELAIRCRDAGNQGLAAVFAREAERRFPSSTPRELGELGLSRQSTRSPTFQEIRMLASVRDSARATDLLVAFLDAGPDPEPVFVVVVLFRREGQELVLQPDVGGTPSKARTLCAFLLDGELERALQGGLSEAELRALAGRLALVEGRWSDALRWLAPLKSSPFLALARFRSGHGEEVVHDLRPALEIANEVLSSVELPDVRRLSVRHGELGRRAADAWEMFQDARAREPGEARARGLEEAAHGFGLVAQSSEPDAQFAAVNEAIVRLHLGQADDAARVLSAVAQRLPRDASVRWAELVSMLRTGRSRSAVSVARELLEVNPGHRVVRRLLAALLVREGDLPAAAKVFAEASPRFDDGASWSLFLWVAKSLPVQGAVAATLDGLARLLSEVGRGASGVQPPAVALSSPPARLLDADELDATCERLSSEGNGERALRFIEDYLARHPSYVPAALLRCRMLSRVGRAPEALEQLERLDRQANDEQKRSLNRLVVAECLFANGDVTAAVEVLERDVLPTRGWDKRAQELLLTLRSATGSSASNVQVEHLAPEYDRLERTFGRPIALDWARRVARDKPTWVPSWIFLAERLEEAQLPREAEKAFSHALRATRVDMAWKPTETRARHLTERGEYTRAVEAILDAAGQFEGVLDHRGIGALVSSLAMQDPSGLGDLLNAKVMRRQGDQDGADRCLRAALEKSEDERVRMECKRWAPGLLQQTARVGVERTRTLWRRTYVSTGRHDDGVAYIRRIRGKQPDDAGFARLEAEALRLAGRDAEAVDVLRELVERFGQRDDRLLLGDALAGCRREQEEMEQYSILLDENPFDIAVHDRLVSLARTDLLPCLVSDRVLLQQAARAWGEKTTGNDQRLLYQNLRQLGATEDVFTLVRFLHDRQPKVIYWENLYRELGCADRAPVLPAAPQRPQHPRPAAAPGERELVSRRRHEVERRAESLRDLLKGDGGRAISATSFSASIAELCPLAFARREVQVLGSAADVVRRGLSETEEKLALASSHERLDRLLEQVVLKALALQMGLIRESDFVLGPLHAIRELPPAEGLDRTLEVIPFLIAAASRSREQEVALRRLADLASALVALGTTTNVDERQALIRRAHGLSRPLKDRPFERALADLAASFRPLILQHESSVQRAARLSVRIGPTQPEHAASEDSFELELTLVNEGEAPAHAVDVRFQSSAGTELRPERSPASLAADGRPIVVRVTVCNPERARAIEIRGSVRYEATASRLRAETSFQEVIVPPWSDARGRPLTNPYTPGSVAQPGMPSFVKRAALVDDIRRSLGEGRGVQNAVLLHGLRRIGKTSVLYDLCANPPQGLVLAYVDIEKVAPRAADLSVFLRSIATEVSEAALAKGVTLEMPAMEHWRERPTEAMSEFDASVGRVIGRSVLVLLDEFEILLEKIAYQHPGFDMDALAFLRHLIQHGRGLSFMVAGAQGLRDFVRSYDQRLYSLFVPYRVGFLSHDEARELVTTPLGKQVAWPPSSVRILVEETAGHPRLLQELCHDIVNLLARENRTHVMPLDVERCIARHVEDRDCWEVPNGLFNKLALSPIEQLVLGIIAELMAGAGFAQAPEVSERARVVDPTTDVGEVTEKLAALSLLDERTSPDGTREYRVSIPLFARWIRRNRGVSYLAAQLLEFAAPVHHGSEQESLEPKGAEEPSAGEEEIETAAAARPRAVVTPSAPVIPYTQGRPVSEDGRFFGREDLLLRARMLLAGRGGHLEVYGPRRMGKTSILKRLKGTFPWAPNDVVVDWGSDQYQGRTWNDFIDALSGAIWEALAGRVTLPSDAGAGPERLGAMVAAATKKGLHLVLLLDEFQAFVESAGLGLDEFRFLRGFTQYPDRYQLTYVVGTTLRLARLSREAVSSEFPNVFVSMGIGPLDKAAAIAMVEEPARRSGLALPRGAGADLHALCGGHPFITAAAAFELSVRLASGRDPDLGPNGLDGWCAALRDPLETLFRRIPEAAHDEVREFVANDFNAPVHFGGLSAALEALLDTGLCQERAGWPEPMGRLGRVFLKQRFGVMQAIDAPATAAERTALQRLVHQVEPRLRRWLEDYLQAEYGAAWATALPDGKMRTLLGPVNFQLNALGFGPLLKVSAANEGFKMACRIRGLSSGALESDVFQLIDARNHEFHSREISGASARRATETLELLIHVLDYF